MQQSFDGIKTFPLPRRALALQLTHIPEESLKESDRRSRPEVERPKSFGLEVGAEIGRGRGQGGVYRGESTLSAAISRFQPEIVAAPSIESERSAMSAQMYSKIKHKTSFSSHEDPQFSFTAPSVDQGRTEKLRGMGKRSDQPVREHR